MAEAYHVAQRRVAAWVYNRCKLYGIYRSIWTLYNEHDLRRALCGWPMFVVCITGIGTLGGITMVGSHVEGTATESALSQRLLTRSVSETPSRSLTPSPLCLKGVLDVTEMRTIHPTNTPSQYQT